MQAFKPLVGILLIVGLIIWVAKWKESLQQRLPARFGDKIRSNVHNMASNVLAIYSSNNQNGFVSLLRLTEDDAKLTQLRQLLTDEELANITQINVVALSNALKTEQNKVFQRVAYFLPQRVAHEAYAQWFFPDSQLPGVLNTNNGTFPNQQLYNNVNNPESYQSAPYNSSQSSITPSITPSQSPANGNQNIEASIMTYPNQQQQSQSLVSPAFRPQNRSLLNPHSKLHRNPTRSLSRTRHSSSRKNRLNKKL